MKTEHKIYASLGILAVLGGGLYVATQDKKDQAAKHSAVAASADLPSNDPSRRCSFSPPCT